MATYDGLISNSMYRLVDLTNLFAMTFNQVSFEFKTTVLNGQIMNIYHQQTSGQTYLIKFSVVQGHIEVEIKLSTMPAQTFRNVAVVSDNEWFTVTLVQMTATTLQLSVKSSTQTLTSDHTLSLGGQSKTLDDIIKAQDVRIIIGRDGDYVFHYFKGCLTNIRIGDINSMLLLPFYTQDQFNNFTRSQYFEVTSKSVLTPGCVAGDACRYSSCQSQSLCVPGFYDYSCSCSSGYGGRWCQTNIQDCPSNMPSNGCQNSGICVDKVDDFYCKCRPGYSGTR